jgi:mannose-6-phosphate isomerase-like protein (cupin superfamily)
MPIDIALKGHLSKNIIVQPTIEDIGLVENLRVRKIKCKNKGDFRNVVVSKPWGLEYLCGRNKHLEVWELYIDPRASTSLHCHPEKDTLNIILEGSAILETISGKEMLTAGDFRIIKAGAIHRTINQFSSCARVLEIESPPNKYDLIRIQDSYGRESLGYITSTKQKFSSKDKIHIPLNSCFSLKKNAISEKFSICDFARMVYPENNSRSVWMKEIVFSGLTFESEKTGLFNYIKEQSLKNLIVAEGSVVFADEKGCRKLLPGECVHNILLSEFNWSSTKATALVW